MEKDNYSMFVTEWFLPESCDIAEASPPAAAEQVPLPAPPVRRLMKERCCADPRNRPLDPQSLSDMR